MKASGTKGGLTRHGSTEQLSRPGRSATCLRTRSATSTASAIRPASSSALTCASAMLNLMCGASKERVAAAYPASATATASVVRPASADMSARTQAISAPTTGRQVVQRELFRRLDRRIRMLRRKPVHGEEGIDIATGLR